MWSTIGVQVCPVAYSPTEFTPPASPTTFNCNRSGVLLASARACWPLLVPTAGVLTVESAGALASTTRTATARTSTACGWPFNSGCGGSVVTSAGAGPCFLAVDDQAQPQWLLIANYLAGTGAAIRILPSGQLSESPTSVIDEHS